MIPEKPLPDPAASGADAPAPRVIPLRRAEPGTEDAMRAAAAVADATMVATDDDPELEAIVEPRFRRRWLLSMPATRTWSPPVTGALAVIFGTAALFKLPLFLAPLAILLALIAGWRGHHGWAVIGLGTALVGLLTSAWFWTLLGLAWLYQSWG